MMFNQAEAGDYHQLMPGIEIKTLVYGDKTLMAQYRLQKGSRLPEHAHPHEQTGFLVSGKIRMYIGEDAMEAGPGDSWCIPGNVTHFADVIEEAVAVEIFAPVREDFLTYTATGEDR